ncbi:uncharacterized protein [Panulirus ornatus]|uniref:uncharacterized protein n=1 Tax=Panulirus ornatus TaxID=150431 RepID=UPI003A84201B
MEDKDELIAKLTSECESLKKELEKSMQERDVLLCEVNRLKFELQMSDLKRLKEEETSEARARREGRARELRQARRNGEGGKCDSGDARNIERPFTSGTDSGKLVDAEAVGEGHRKVYK